MKDKAKIQESTNKPIKIRLVATKGGDVLRNANGVIGQDKLEFKIASKAEFDKTIGNYIAQGFDYYEIIEHGELVGNKGKSFGEDYYMPILKDMFSREKSIDGSDQSEVINALKEQNQDLSDKVEQLMKVVEGLSIDKTDDQSSNEDDEKVLIMKELDSLGAEYKKTFGLSRLKEILAAEKE